MALVPSPRATAEKPCRRVCALVGGSLEACAACGPNVLGVAVLVGAGALRQTMQSAQPPEGKAKSEEVSFKGLPAPQGVARLAQTLG